MNNSNASLNKLINVADELPEPGGGTIAAIVAAVLFVAGFAATLVIYYMSYNSQIAERDRRRRLRHSGAACSSPPSGSSPMSHEKAMDMMMFEESNSRSSTPDFEPLQPSPHQLASFRVPVSPMAYAQHARQPQVPPPAQPHVMAHDALMRSQSYFVDSDEELLESRRRPSAPLVGGSRVHLQAASNDQYFDDM